MNAPASSNSDPSDRQSRRTASCRSPPCTAVPHRRFPSLHPRPSTALAAVVTPIPFPIPIKSDKDSPLKAPSPAPKRSGEPAQSTDARPPILARTSHIPPPSSPPNPTPTAPLKKKNKQIALWLRPRQGQPSAQSIARRASGSPRAHNTSFFSVGCAPVIRRRARWCRDVSVHVVGKKNHFS